MHNIALWSGLICITLLVWSHHLIELVMQRVYTEIINNHLKQYTQMAFISGPRQVGKTTISKDCAKNIDNTEYLNWDNVVHRKKISWLCSLLH